MTRPRSRNDVAPVSAIASSTIPSSSSSDSGAGSSDSRTPSSSSSRSACSSETPARTPPGACARAGALAAPRLP
jgi:hypothetical protein